MVVDNPICESQDWLSGTGVGNGVDLPARLVLAAGMARLEMAGIESARLEARIFLERCLGLARAELYSRPEWPVPAARLAEYFDLVGRRQRREPLAYILGCREFFGLEFLVDSRALVPRPETELLVEEAVRHLRGGYSRVADIGTGCGTIAVSLVAQRLRIHVFATDISRPALDLAAENCRRHEVTSMVTLLHGDLVAPLPSPVDLIVANLPYLSADDIDYLQPELTYEPNLALDGGEDGLDLYRRFLRDAPAALRPGGRLIFEIGASQEPTAIALARQSFPEAAIRLVKDYGGLDRIVIVETDSRSQSG